MMLINYEKVKDTALFFLHCLLSGVMQQHSIANIPDTFFKKQCGNIN